MGRWQPGARERLQREALDLYLRQGFDATTVDQIARAAGLSERSFFRHFADKREVLFDGQDVLVTAFTAGVDAAPADASPFAVASAALASAADFFPDERRPWSRERQRVIEATPALQERELLKLAGLATTLAAALRGRGAPEPAATLAAESALTVFGVAFAQWIADGETRPFGELSRLTLAELTTMSAGG